MENHVISLLKNTKHRLLIVSKSERSRLRGIRKNLSPKNKKNRKLIRENFDWISNRPARSRGSQIWAVSVVRNESDIISETIDHLYAQGVHGILIADNLSTDGTMDILLKKSKEYNNLLVIKDSLDAHMQEHKIQELANIASSLGAKWIIPFDADEFWFARKGTLEETLSSSRSTIFNAKIHNLFPTKEIPSPTDWAIDVQPARLQKVAFVNRKFTHIHHGNHAVDSAGSIEHSLVIVHLPWRSLEQFQTKIRIGSRALVKAGFVHLDEAGDHWQDLNRLSDEGLRAAWLLLAAGGSPANMEWVPRGELVPTHRPPWDKLPLPSIYGS